MSNEPAAMNPHADMADARANMVDSQLRPTRVTDRRVIEAMRRLPREAFVPASSRAMAYGDVEVPSVSGRFLLPPLVVARMIQAAATRYGDSVLVLGAGYAAAVFAAIGAAVTAVEPDAAAASLARDAYAQAGVTVHLVTGPLDAGWSQAAPYDCIMIDGAVRTLPALGAQLRTVPAGRLCALLLGAAGRSGLAVLAECAEGGLAHRPIMDSAATPLTAFDPPATFRF